MITFFKMRKHYLTTVLPISPRVARRLLKLLKIQFFFRSKSNAWHAQTHYIFFFFNYDTIFTFFLHLHNFINDFICSIMFGFLINTYNLSKLCVKCNYTREFFNCINIYCFILLSYFQNNVYVIIFWSIENT